MRIVDHKLRILVFTEGTILMHRNGVGRSREDIVRQVEEGEESVSDFGSYIPIGDSAGKIETWRSQGAEIVYLTSRTEPGEVEEIRGALERHGFPLGRLEFRLASESYGEVAGRVAPDVLVEDDCESIGGIEMTTISDVRPEFREEIKSVVVREFGGIDDLPDEVQEMSRALRKSKKNI